MSTKESKVIRQLTTPPVYPPDRLVESLRRLRMTDAGLPKIPSLPQVYPSTRTFDQFQIDALIASLEQAAHSVDAYMALERSVDSQIDALVSARESIAHAIDAALSNEEQANFTVDGLICPTPGVLIVIGPAEGDWICPPGVTRASFFLWGNGGKGNAWFPNAGGSGGGAGAFCAAFNRTVAPGNSYHYIVAPSAPGYTFVGSLLPSALFAHEGLFGTTAGGGAGGGASGGDINSAGGSGGNAGLTLSYAYGAGGGQAGSINGNGANGEDSQPTRPGQGGGTATEFGSGGQGGTFPGTTHGLPGNFPGGGGGGQAWDGGILPQNQQLGGAGLLIITWDAGAHFIDAAVSKLGLGGFGIDGAIANKATNSFSLGAYIKSFDGLLADDGATFLTEDGSTTILSAG